MNLWQKSVRFTEPLRVFPFVGFMRIFTTLNTTCFTLFLAYFLKKIVHSIEIRDMVGFTDMLIWASVIMFTFQVLGFIFRNYYWVEQQYTWEPYVYKKYLKKFILLDQGKVEALGTGKTLSILQKGIEELTLSLLGVTAHCTRMIMTLAFSFILARNLPWNLVLGGISIIGGIFGVIVYLNKHTNFYRKQRKENNVKTTGALAKIIMSKFEVLQNDSIDKEIQKIEKISNYSWQLARKQNFWSSLLFQSPKFLLSCIIVGSYYYLGMRVFGGTYSLSEMVGLLTVLALFEVTLRDSIEYYENFTKAFVHIEKLWEFIDNTPEIQGYSTGEKFHFKKGDFEIQDLNFGYHNGQEVLRDFSLTIQGGKKIALVGKSGSGKTTIMKLLTGYMRHSEGKILIDGQDIADIQLKSYYPHIGYLTQEPSVFDGTIRENLLYSMSNAPLRKGDRGDLKKKIDQAIDLAECQFIYELEHGLDTEIGERGIRLSGGQKQRLAIAKIFLKDPEIILLDEPTAALDSYSEEKVAKAFEHLFIGRTVIVIAHRLQTVKSADDIIVLEKGMIAERGTHKQLLKLGGKYAGMQVCGYGGFTEWNREGRTGIIKIHLFSFFSFLYYLHHMSLISSHLILPSFPDYELIDSGNGMKFERYGDFQIARPESQALWNKKTEAWKSDAYFDKSSGGQGKWTKTPADVRDWIMSYGDLSWQCRWSPYRHVGVFPEQAMHWDWTRDVIKKSKRKEPKVLNLFAYTGIASIACAREGAKVTHVDGSKPTIGWAQKNMELSKLPEDSIRWILDDVVKFVEREVRRGNTYDGIIMDPPVFGHGANGEKWEFDTSFPILLENIRKILSPDPLFLLVNTYASSIFSTTLANILDDILPPGTIEHGELGIQEKNTDRSITTGVYARWRK